MSLLASLDHAIDHDELWVAYQPKFECQSGRMIGAEALVRWTHPEKGQLYPDQFIAAAEQGGRIDRLTYFVLDRALAAIAPINRPRPAVQRRRQPFGAAARQSGPRPHHRIAAAQAPRRSRAC